MNIKLPSLFLVLGLFSLSSLFTVVKAQENQFSNQQISLTAMPARLGDEEVLKAKPGGVIEFSVRVRNASNQSLTVASQMSDFILDEDGATPVPVDSQTSGRWSLSSWSSISNQIQEVGPGQTKTVNVLVTVPADALPGGRYAMITHQPVAKGTTKEDLTTQGSASHINQKVGTLVYFLVDGPIHEEAFIRDFQLPKFTEMGPVPFSFTVDNTSDVHLKPKVGITIFNIFGRQVDSFSVESKNIFPFISRSFNGQWNRVWGIGPYTAQLTMSYGEQGNILVVKTGFWLFPIKLFIGLSALILILILGALSVARHLRHRRTQEEQKIELLEKKLEELEQHQSES